MFQLSGTHELHTKGPRREASRPPLRVRGALFVFQLSGTHELCTVLLYIQYSISSIVPSGHDVKKGSEERRTPYVLFKEKSERA